LVDLRLARIENLQKLASISGECDVAQFEDFDALAESSHGVYKYNQNKDLFLDVCLAETTLNA
jgi:hypothetical protein